MHTDEEYKKLYIQYRQLTNQENQLKNQKDILREQINKMLLNDKIKNKTVEIDENLYYEAVFQERANKKVDHILLMENVGQKKYNEIVKIEKSISLIIRKTSERKQSLKKLSQMTKDVIDSLDNTDDFEIPTGNILT